MGNRLHDGVCVICESPIIEPNEWYTCSQCVKIMREKVLKRIKNPGQARKIMVKPSKEGIRNL